jgi:hypothetical protein
MVRRYGHREEHSRHTLESGRYSLGAGQIPDDDLGAEPLQFGRTFVLTTYHETHWHILSTQLLEDGTAHAAGTGDKNKVAGSHQSIPYLAIGHRIRWHSQIDVRRCYRSGNGIWRAANHGGWGVRGRHQSQEARCQRRTRRQQQ